MADRRRTATIRVRVTVAATVAVALVLVVASLLLVARQRSGLLEQLDEGLAAEAERIAGAAAAGSMGPLPDDDDRVVVVRDGTGAAVATSGDGEELADLQALPADDVGTEVELDGAAHRVAVEGYDGRGGSGIVLVAEASDDVDDAVGELTASLLLIVPAAVVALLVVVWVLVGRTLRPVERIRAQVAGIGVGELDRRVPEPAGRDELARLAVTMNAMLARLEASVRHQQRFVADASHELRTPLTRMRAELEVDERHPDGADPAATRRSLLEEVAALQRMLEDLLVLARSDAGAPRRSEPVDLDDLVFEEVRAGGPAPAVDVGGVSAAQVTGDADELRRLVRNLLDNARRHAAGHVVVLLAEHDATATLVVADDGPGIPPAQRAEVFERFARLDVARSGGAGRAGLGLAIVHDIATRHGGTVDLDDAPGGGARFSVHLPAAGRALSPRR